MAEGGEEIEMGNRGWEEEEEEEEDGAVETSFATGDLRKRLDGVSQPHMSDPSVRVTSIEDGVPDVGKDVGAMKKSDTSGKKIFFLNLLGVKIRKGDGPASEKLLDFTSFEEFKNGNIRVKFNGKLLRTIDDKGVTINSKAGSRNKIIKQFDDLMEEAKIEHSKRVEGMVEEIYDDPMVSEEVVDDTVSQASLVISDRVEERTAELQNQAEGIFISEQEIREFSGVLNPQGMDTEKIEALEKEANYYRIEAMTKDNPVEGQFYKNISETAELKADSIRIKTGERPEHTEAISILSETAENNDLGKLERFKRWAKDNMVGLSAVAISIAGIITTIVIAARKAILGGAKAVSGFAKALANLAKKLGPLLAPLFNLLAQVLVWGAKGIGWLASNLWVLAIAMAWLLYDYWKNRKSKK